MGSSGIQSKWNEIIIRTSGNNNKRPRRVPQQQSTAAMPRQRAAADAGNFIYLFGIIPAIAYIDPQRVATPRGIRCGGSFVKGCARITCQGLNRSIANSPKPLLNAQKLITHKHTSSNN